MQTSNDPGIEKLMDMTRFVAIAILLLHFYLVCYQVFVHWHLRSDITDRMLGHFARTGIFDGAVRAKVIALGALVLSLMGIRGNKHPYLKFRGPATLFAAGAFLYFASPLIISVPAVVTTAVRSRGMLYMGLTLLGFLLMLRGGALMTRLVKARLLGEVFNKDNETFPQEERHLDTE
jgi:hypothetical protein